MLLKLNPKNELTSQASSVPSSKNQESAVKASTPYTNTSMATKKKKGGALKIIN